MKYTVWRSKVKYTALSSNSTKTVFMSLKTPVGLTDQCDMGEGVSQGSVEGTSISAASE